MEAAVVKGTISTRDASGTPSTYHVHGRGDSVGTLSAPERVLHRHDERHLGSSRIRRLRDLDIDRYRTIAEPRRYQQIAPAGRDTAWGRGSAPRSVGPVLLVVTVERR